MRVYRIIEDSNHYQSLQIEFEGDTFPLDEFTFDGTPKAATWKPPEVFVRRPKLRKGDFARFCSGVLAIKESSLKGVQMHFEMAGELLPLTHEGERFVVLNVLECINVLNQEKAEWYLSPRTGERVSLTKYAFNRRRFTVSSIFKVPETCRGTVLTYEGLRAPEDEFKPTYERLGLTGLRFEEVWSDEEERFPRLSR